MPKYKLKNFADDRQLAETAASKWLDCLAAAEAAKPFLVALSGGRIARTFFSSAANIGKSKRDLFNPVHFFWADERCVPPTDAESNYRIAQELLFAPLGIPEAQIHRIRGEDPPHVAATKATDELVALAAKNPAGTPVLDLIFLGMGEDGHVASLFPGESPPGPEPVYRPVTASKPPPQRITLSYTAIAAAKEVWVLASGSGKEDALRSSLKPGATTPLGRVLEQRDRTLILSDIRL